VTDEVDGNAMRGVKMLLAVLGAALAAGGCADDDTTLVVELVPNPEVNTSADVAARVNRLEFVLDAEGGFAGDVAQGESWYTATDVDDDGDLELTFERRGSVALQPFVLEQGSQGDRVIDVSARGKNTDGQLAALGGSAARFEPARQASLEVPFNLLPAFRPLRVLSMNPPDGSQGLTAPVTALTLQLSGEVLASALDEIELRHEGGPALEARVTVSYVDAAMGRLTNVKLDECDLFGGAYTVVLRTDVCSVAGQCLDQYLGVEGAQPFEGAFSVDGPPQAPGCSAEVAMGGVCPETCDPGYECDEGVGICVQIPDVGLPEGGGLCDPSWCDPGADLVCDGSSCVPSCVPWGACPDPARHCDLDTGLCE
jgi:hypothetical protein